MKDALAKDSDRYLCFTLGTEEYGVPLLTVREVVALPKISPIPQAPAYFLGLMNLRGTVIPLMDLRKKMGITPSPKSESVVVIIDLQPSPLGVLVDSINHVLNATEDKISDTPSLEATKKNEFITGVYRKDANLVLLLDIKKALDVKDQKTMATSTARAAA